MNAVYKKDGHIFSLKERKISLRVFYVISFLMIMAVPSYFLGRGAMVACSLLSVVLFLVFFSRSIFYVVWERSRSFWGGAGWFAFVLLCFIGLRSSTPLGSLVALLYGVSWVVYGYMMVLFFKDNPFVYRRILYFSVILLLLAMVGETIVFALRSFPFLSVHLMGSMKSPFYMRDFSSGYGIFVPFLWAYCYGASKKHYRALFLLYVVFSLLMLHLSHSRSGLMGLIASSGVLILFSFSFVIASFKRRYGVILFVFFAMFCVMGGVFFALPSLPYNLAKPFIIPFNEPRQIIWSYTLHLISLKPWLGYGVYGARSLMISQSVAPLYDLPYFNAHPHDFLLQWVLDFGLIGFSCFLLFILRVLYLLTFYWTNRRYNMAALASFTGFLVASLSNYSFWSYWWQGFIVIYMVLMVSMIVIGKEEKSDAKTS